jgi:hypothetical protein
MWPHQIRARAERLTLIIVLSTFAGYLSAFALSVTRFVA